mgnify:CR=1 FL=1
MLEFELSIYLLLDTKYPECRYLQRSYLIDIPFSTSSAPPENCTRSSTPAWRSPSADTHIFQGSCYKYFKWFLKLSWYTFARCSRWREHIKRGKEKRENCIKNGVKLLENANCPEPSDPDSDLRHCLDDKTGNVWYIGIYICKISCLTLDGVDRGR